MRCFIIFTTKKYWSDQIKKNKMPRHVAGMGERRGVYKVLVGKPEGRRPQA
jgi:hypothetical protein